MNGVLIRVWRNAVRSTRSTRSTRCAGAVFGSTELDELMAVAAGLPETTRRVLTLRKVYDFAPRDIAARLGLMDAEVERHLIAAARAVCAGCAGAHPEPPEASSRSTECRAAAAANHRGDL